MAAGPSSKNSKNLQRKTLKPDVTLVIYDGACPFCRAFVRLHRFREDIGPVELLSARATDDRIAHYQQQGFDLDQSMLLVMGCVVHAGADAMQVMAACSTSSGWFNRCNRWIFSSRRLSRLMYPILRAGRRLALLLLGVPLIRKNHH
jgi:predicted DCC family thiol-disulfide oxidoreductase YuxK